MVTRTVFLGSSNPWTVDRACTLVGVFGCLEATQALGVGTSPGPSSSFEENVPSATIIYLESAGAACAGPFWIGGLKRPLVKGMLLYCENAGTSAIGVILESPS